MMPDSFEPGAAGKAALYQRVQPILGVERAGAGCTLRGARDDDDPTGVRPRAVCRVHRGRAQGAQQHAAAELEHALGQLVSGVGVSGGGPQRAGQERKHIG